MSALFIVVMGVFFWVIFFGGAMKLKFKHPKTDYVEEYQTRWVLLFGPFYLLVVGLWLVGIFELLLSFVLLVVLGLMSEMVTHGFGSDGAVARPVVTSPIYMDQLFWFIVLVFSIVNVRCTPRLLRKKLLRAGWIEVPPEDAKK